MARRRMIDPSIWQNEDFSKLSTLAKLVFIGLFSNADDEGRGRAKATFIKSVLFPYEEGMRAADIDKALSEIASKMSVTFYVHNDNEYYSLNKWSKWQKVEKPYPSSIKPYENTDCKAIRGTIGEQSGNVRGTVPPKIREDKIREEEKEYTYLPGAETAPDGSSEYSFLLNDQTTYFVSLKQIAKWKELYPAVDIEQELRSMMGWCDANPSKRKTRSGASRFINNWLTKRQDRGGTPNAGNFTTGKQYGEQF